MHLYVLFFIMQFLSTFSIEDTLFVINYFDIRRIKNIVGFTCYYDVQSEQSNMEFSYFNKTIRISKLSADQISNLFYLKHSQHRLGIFVDRHCMEDNLLAQFYNESNKQYLYTFKYKWLIISTDLDTAVQKLDDYNFGIMTDLIIAVPQNNQYLLYEVYNPCKYRGAELVVNKVGDWKDNQFNVSFFDQNFPRRYNLGGITLKMSGLTVYRPPDAIVSQYLQAYKDISKDSMTKFTYILTLHYADFFNFRLDIADYTKWFLEDRVGPVVHGLDDRSIDICGSPLIMTNERAKYVEFLFPIWPFRTFFLFRTTLTTHLRLGEFLLPFITLCWYCLIAITVISSAVLSFILTFEKTKLSNLDIIGAGIVITFGSLCQQGSAFILQKTPGRIAFLSELILSLLIYNYYSASVVSTRLDKPIDKINDSLVELTKTDVRMSAEPSLFFNFVLNQSEWEVNIFRKHWYMVPENKRFLIPEKAVKLIQKGGFAYHTTPEAIYPLVERTFDNRKICELTEVHLSRPQFLYMNTRLDSPFTEIMRLGSVIMHERGLLKRQLIRWQTRRPECRTDVLSAQSITLIETAPTFFLLIFGMFLSLIVLVIENIVYRKQKRHNTKFQKRKRNTILRRVKTSWLLKINKIKTI